MGARLLVAERSPTLRKLIQRTLSQEDVDVVCVGDGQAALASIRSEEPDLLLVDRDLPGVDGYELAGALREGSPGSDVSVVLMISDSQQPDLERMAHVGIQDVLTKPFEQHALVERIRGHLGLSAPAPTETPTQDHEDGFQGGKGIEALVERLVADRLRQVVDAAVADALVSLAGERLQDVVDASIARVVTEDFDMGNLDLGPQTESALQAAARTAVEARLADGGQDLLGPWIEPVVWKVVPELAEGQIKDEIHRLLEGEDDT